MSFPPTAEPGADDVHDGSVALGCDYQGHEFGASYLDSVCIDGWLWDADSCDEPGGPLFEGGEIPCPRCNTAAFLDAAKLDAKDGGCGTAQWHPWCAAVIWESAVAKALRENQAVATRWLAACAPFVTDDWPDRLAVYEGRAPWGDTVERQWPWATAAASIMQDDATGTEAGGPTPNPEGN